MIPIITCSPRNFALVQEYGAEKIFDYHDPTSPGEIRSYTKNALYYALDCFCDAASMAFCYAAIGRAGGKYTTFEPFHPEIGDTRRAITPPWVINSAILGKTVGWKELFDVQPDPHIRFWKGMVPVCAADARCARDYNPSDQDSRAGRFGRHTGRG